MWESNFNNAGSYYIINSSNFHRPRSRNKPDYSRRNNVKWEKRKDYKLAYVHYHPRREFNNNQNQTSNYCLVLLYNKHFIMKPDDKK